MLPPLTELDLLNTEPSVIMGPGWFAKLNHLTSGTGCYALFENEEPVYIGVSTGEFTNTYSEFGIRERLRDRASNDDKTLKVWYMASEDALRAEAITIAKYKPTMNKVFAAHDTDTIRKDRKKRRRKTASLKLVVKYDASFIRCCYKCHVNKPSSEYYKSSFDTHGIRKHCKDCEHENYKERSERI